MELLVWLFIAVLLITYGGALALSVGVVLAVLSVVPWWITLVMVAGWFTKEYAVVVREERAVEWTQETAPREDASVRQRRRAWRMTSCRRKQVRSSFRTRFGI